MFPKGTGWAGAFFLQHEENWSRLGTACILSQLPIPGIREFSCLKT